MHRCGCRAHLRRADRKPWVLAVDGLRQHGVLARVEVVWFKIEVRNRACRNICCTRRCADTCCCLCSLMLAST